MQETISRQIYQGAVLRTAVLADIPMLVQMERGIDIVPGFNRWNITRWMHEINTNYVWVIEQGHEIIYTIGFIMSIEDQEIDVIKLSASAVGRPLTGKLILAGAGWLQERGIRKIRGRCAEGLKEFYKKMGFNETGELPHYFGLDTSGFSIERVL